MSSENTDDIKQSVEETNTNVNFRIYDSYSSQQHLYRFYQPSPSPLLIENENNSPIRQTLESNTAIIKRKKKNSNRENITRTELIPGFRGDQNIDELVEFINERPPPSVNHNGNKLNKKSKPKH